MAWETRNGNRYYYRSVRGGEKVRKEYVGTGPLALLAAKADEEALTAHRERRERERAELERLEALAAPVRELDEKAEVLARACLVAAGYRRRKGQWRMARG